MFVPVGCTSCGKPFQVPETALGKLAACPWCQSTVTALPVAAVVEPAPAVAAPAQKPPAPEWLKEHPRARPGPHPADAIPVAVPARPRPLSLDGAEPRRPSDLTRPNPLRGFHPLMIAAVVALTLGVMVLTAAALGYGSGRVQEAWWTEFTPPDGSCSVLLPGAPVEEDVEPNPAGSVAGGKRFVAKGWYTRSAAWLAWGDLDPAFVATAAKDKDKVFTASVIQAELNREKGRLQGTVTKEVGVRFNSAWGVEAHMDTPRGKVIEWLLVAPDGHRPRLYVYGLQATNIAHDSAVVRRMFTSFKVKE